MTAETQTPAWVMFQNAGVADFYALFFVGYTDNLAISFVRLPANERLPTLITCGRHSGQYQLSERLLTSGVRALSLALIDALAQTRSGSGRCDISYEKALAEMILECIEEGRQASPN